jgi:hypothetical protein
MRQTKDEFKQRYALVIDRIHNTGLDTLFQGKMPPSIKTELESLSIKEVEVQKA